MAAFITYVIAETNNSNMLIRTRSRMVASVWVFGMACLGMLHPFHPSILPAFCMGVSHYLLFRTYQRTQPVVDVFHTFVMLAVGSIVFPPMVFLMPFYLWYLLVFMRSLTFRAFCAAWVGSLFPFWLWSGWLIWEGDLQPLVGWWQELRTVNLDMLRMEFPNFTFSALSLSFLVLAAFVLWTGIAYLLHSFNDKIRTRMMFYIYIMQSSLILLFAVLFHTPEMLHNLLPLLLVCASPLLAHYFTLTNTWVCLIVFWLFLLAFAGLGVLTLFPESPFVINFVNPALHIG